MASGCLKFVCGGTKFADFWRRHHGWTSYYCYSLWWQQLRGIWCCAVLDRPYCQLQPNTSCTFSGTVAYVSHRQITRSSPLLKFTARQPGNVTNVVNKDAEIEVLDDSDGTSQVMIHRQAEAVAKTRDLKLVLADDSSARHVYKLMSAKDFAAEARRLKEAQKALKPATNKSLTLSGKISAHDLDIKSKQLIEWLTKGRNVAVTIKNDGKLGEKGADVVFNYIVKATKAVAKVKQARRTDTTHNVELSPTATVESTDGVNSTDKPSQDKLPKPLKLDELKNLNKNKSSQDIKKSS